MPSLIYNSFLEDLARGAIDVDADAFRVMLVTASYAESKDAHTKRADVTNEVTGSGYTAGGVTCAVTVTKDTANDRLDITLGAVAWPSSTITARKAVYYKSRGGAASADELVAVNDFGSDVISSGATFSVALSTVRFQN
jgi:hypothetical protein